MKDKRKITILPSTVLDTKTGEIKPLPTDHESEEYKEIMFRMYANKRFCGIESVVKSNEV